MLLLEKEPANRLPGAGALVIALQSGNVPELRGNAVARPLASGIRVASPAPQPAPPVALGEPGVPTARELERWNTPAVMAFRRGATPWAFFGVAAVILSLFGVIDVVGLWGLWTIFIAWRYAKLWTDGYDWRDVMKEPRDRMFFDVVAEWVDSVRALWDPRKRAEVRERERLRSQRDASILEGGANRALLAAGNPGAISSLAGNYAHVVSEAARNRDDILRLIQTLPKRDRATLSDIPAGASALYQKIEALALNLTEMERNLPDMPLHALDSEITKLESEANPLDTRGSEERVRRLAFLKRQRRAVADIDSRAALHREKLESCSIALQNMRLDVVRLKAGSQTFAHITSVAEKAVALAREVDTAMYVKDEMSKLTGRRSGSARRQ
jgi:serine/threonine-protein kinase